MIIIVTDWGRPLGSSTCAKHLQCFTCYNHPKRHRWLLFPFFFFHMVFMVEVPACIIMVQTVICLPVYLSLDSTIWLWGLGLTLHLDWLKLQVAGALLSLFWSCCPCLSSHLVLIPATIEAAFPSVLCLNGTGSPWACWDLKHVVAKEGLNRRRTGDTDLGRGTRGSILLPKG